MIKRYSELPRYVSSCGRLSELSRFLGFGRRFGLLDILVSRGLLLWFPEGQGFGSRGSFWADFEIFEILGGAGDIYNSISMPNYYHTCLP